MKFEIELTASPALLSALTGIAEALKGTQVPTTKQEVKHKPVSPNRDPENVGEGVEVKQEKKVKAEPPKQEAKPVETDKPKEEPNIKLETVRAKLADLSVAGKQAQVKELITSFIHKDAEEGEEVFAKKLGDISPSDYAALLDKAEQL